MHIGINNNIHLNPKQFLLLLVILFVLFSLYNRIYIANYCVTDAKYKHLVKKYKNMTEKYQKKFTEFANLVNTQNSIIQEYSNLTTSQIGTHNSAQSNPIKPSKFNDNQQKEQLMTSIDQLLKTNDNDQSSIALPDPNMSNIQMQANGPSSFDTFWTL